MTVPRDVGERIARTWRRGGGRVLAQVSVCHTERGALRVAAKYPYAEVVDDGNGRTWTVWAVREDEHEATLAALDDLSERARGNH